MKPHQKQLKRQQGMVLPIVVVMALIILSSMLYMYNSGQMVQEKIRLTNTQDAAVYGGGMKMARIFNFYAYSNRAMILNSMAIAYGVGLASWLDQTDTAVKNLRKYDRKYDQTLLMQIYPAFASGQVATPNDMGAYRSMLGKGIMAQWEAQKAMGVVQGNVQDGFEPEGAAYRDWGSIIRYMRKYNRMNYALEDGRDTTIGAGNKDEGDNEAEGGTKDEGEFYAKLLPGEGNKTTDVAFDMDMDDQFANVSMQLRYSKSGGDDLGDMIEMTDKEYNDGREFLHDRGWSTPVVYILRVGPYEIPVPGNAKKRGASVYLGQDRLGLAALDSMSIHWITAGIADKIADLFSGPFKKIPSYRMPVGEEPFGYAHLYSNDKIENIDNDFAGSKSDNPKGHKEARKTHAKIESVVQSDNWNKVTEYPPGAVPNFASLGPNMLNKSDPVMKLTARNYRKMSATRTIAGTNSLNSNSIKPSGRLDVWDGNLEKNKDAVYSAVATAEIFFDRPEDRKDGRTEKGNFYNPYWHVRLVKVSDTNRQKAQEAHGKDSGGLSLYVE